VGLIAACFNASVCNKPRSGKDCAKSAGECHVGLVIPNGRATDEQPAKPGGPSSQEVVGRYRADGLRRWYTAAFAVAWLLFGTVLFVRHHQWWGLAFAAVWVALAATVWVRPQMVISDQGVRLGWRIIPWSQVVDVVAPPSNGWKQQPPELVLRDGRRQPLPELTASQIDGLRSLARKHGSPLPPSGGQIVP
jgi:hypothetical protein